MDLDDRTCPCCDLRVVGKDVAEHFHIVLAQFRVIATRRPKYACGCART